MIKGSKHSWQTKQKMSDSLKGNPAWNKGITMSIESKMKLSESCKGRIPWNKGLTNIYSNETLKKISKGRKGKIPWNKKYFTEEEKKQASYIRHKNYAKNNRERYNLTKRTWEKNNPLRNLSYYQKRYRKLGSPHRLSTNEIRWALQTWSDTVKVLCRNQCQYCFNKAEISHHIIHKSKYPALSLNINNGIALCRNCHAEVHGWNTSH